MSFTYDGHEDPDSCPYILTAFDGLSGEGYFSVSSNSSTNLIPTIF